MYVFQTYGKWTWTSFQSSNNNIYLLSSIQPSSQPVVHLVFFSIRSFSMCSYAWNSRLTVAALLHCEHIDRLALFVRCSSCCTVFGFQQTNQCLFNRWIEQILLSFSLPALIVYIWYVRFNVEIALRFFWPCI